MSWGTSKKELESFNDLNDIRKRLHELEINISKMNETTVVDTSPTFETVGGDSPPIAGGSSAFESIQFVTDPDVPNPIEGEIYWNVTDKTLNIKTDTDTIVQVGQEQLLRINNDTGVQLNNGEIVYVSGVTSSRPTITLADASTWEDSQKTIGIATSDIPNGSEGFITTFGLVRDLNTIGLNAGDELFLSTTAGDFTTTRPTHPDYVISIGYVIDVHATDGIIFFRVENNDDGGFFNGTTKQTFDAVVTEAAGVVTLSLEKAGGGDLTMRFSDGNSTLDCTPAKTLVLTADVGTDAAPQPVFVYILQSNKILARSLSGWPATEHIKICYILLPSAAFVASDGVYVNQNWNDHAASDDLQGHIAHIGQKLRLLQATWFSGVAGNGTQTYLTPTAGNTEFKSTAGVVFQMHGQTFPAFDTSTGDTVLVKNWNGDAYHNITNLYDITADSGGVAIGNNKYFNLVCWGAMNKSGETQFLLINLPSGSYSKQSDAENDDNGYDDFTIPRDFNVDSSVGFLICRITIQMKTGGGTWIHQSTVDLRGTTPQTATGGAAGSRYTDAEAIAAVEGEATLDVLHSDLVTVNSNDHHTKYTDAEAVDAIEASNIITQTGTSPRKGLYESGVAVDEKWWEFLVDASIFSFRAINDANNNSNPILNVLRTTFVVDRIDIYGTTTKIINKLGIGMVPTTDLELTNDSAQKPTTNTWAITSDMRIKSVVGDYLGGLDLIKQIHPRIWNYKDAYNFKACQGNHIGVIADEIETIVPSTVKMGKHDYNFSEIDTGRKDKDDKPVMKEIFDTVDLKTFNSNDLIYVVINALKEIDTRLTALEEKK